MDSVSPSRQFFILTSSETKPTVGVQPWAMAVESDTGDVFFWDNTTWHRIKTRGMDHFVLATLSGYSIDLQPAGVSLSGFAHADAGTSGCIITHSTGFTAMRVSAPVAAGDCVYIAYGETEDASATAEKATCAAAKTARTAAVGATSTTLDPNLLILNEKDHSGTLKLADKARIKTVYLEANTADHLVAVRGTV